MFSAICTWLLDAAEFLEAFASVCADADAADWLLLLFLDAGLLLLMAGRTKLSASVPWTRILVMSKTLRFLALVLAHTPSCFSIRSEAKLRLHTEHGTSPLSPLVGAVEKMDRLGAGGALEAAGALEADGVGPDLLEELLDVGGVGLLAGMDAFMLVTDWLLANTGLSAIFGLGAATAISSLTNLCIIAIH